jgi:sigma-B regulation protein RsbU (phosphoserine phosphatase)
MRLEVPGEVSRLPEVTRSLQAEWQRLELPADSRRTFELALEEIFTNIALHAKPATSPESGAKPIRVTVSLDVRSRESRASSESSDGSADGGDDVVDDIVMEIRDTGAAFDPLSVARPDINASVDDRPVGGLGIHLVREMMTEVRYSREGQENVLRMRKGTRGSGSETRTETRTEDRISPLAASKLLSTSSGAVVRDVAAAIEIMHVEAGEPIITKGETGTDMFIIVDGQVRVHDGDLVYSRLDSGEVFGEVAALDGGVRTASVTAEVDCSLFRLDQQAMREMLARDPEAAAAIIRMLCEREKRIINDYQERALTAHLLEREFEIGKQIQRDFLPDSIPEVTGWEFAARFRGAREVSGDFYDVFSVDALGRVAVVVGDVCGKGLGAALFMTLFRSLLRASTRTPDLMPPAAAGGSANAGTTESSAAARKTLGDAIALTNSYVAETHANSSMFASLFVGLIDPRTGVLTYANCGHEVPVVFGGDGVVAELHPTGPVAGIVEFATFDIEEITLDPGQGLVAFTDGVTEAVSADGRMFSRDRLVGLLSADRPAQDLLDAVVIDIDSFAAGTSQFDDITLLAVRRVDSAAASMNEGGRS